MAKETLVLEETERRHTVSIWWYLLAVLAFLGACYLLFIEDATQGRTTLPAFTPRSEAPLSVPRTNLAIAPAATPRSVDVGRPSDVAAATEVFNARAFSADFISGLWREAEAAGVKRPTFDRAMSVNLTPDPEVVALNSNQPEFDRTTGEYVGSIVNTERIAVGRARLEQQSAILGDIERRYGVDRHILLAIWGLESNFGAAKGDRSVIRSLATLAAAEPRRSAFWRSELVAALSILEQDKLVPEKLVGSWAGAMGHTQFMPSTFMKFAVDFDGDGQRDIWNSAPDALASTARYLQASGWVTGRPWGREVVVPADFDYSLATPAAARSIVAWRVAGLRPQAGALPVDDGASWQLIVPAGAGGPAFLVSSNFDALLTYNRSYSYAIAVGTLADRIAGAAPIQAAWPVGDVPLSRDQRIELQEILASLSFDVGGVDGIIGTKTRDAIRSFQKVRGLQADGYPTLALLNRLRKDRRL